MPTDSTRQRPPLEGHRTNSTVRITKEQSDSLASTPPTQPKAKGTKAHHVVGARTGLHARNHSHGKLHRSKSHVDTQNSKRRISTPSTSPGPQESISRVVSESKLSRDDSTTSLRKNSSQVSLKRNRSTADVKRPKSSGQLKRSASHSKVHNNKNLQRSNVHFDLGNDEHEDVDGDGWTEASGSASPNISRAGSVAGQSSGRSSARQPASADNSRPESPIGSPTKTGIVAKEWSSSKSNITPDAAQITSRLLQRTPSQNAPPKMSDISATAIPGAQTSSSSSYQKTPSTANGTPHSNKEPVVSRFVGEPQGTPADSSTFLTHRPKDPQRELDAARKVKSMGNLTRQDSNEADSDEERALAPRSRKGSAHAYKPPQQSRTQQKMWLQRASSTNEPQQLAPSAQISINDFPALALNANPLVGAGYDGRDPRVKAQLDKTGMEYLVVRRYQDPVGRALRRLGKLPGNEKMRRIPSTKGKNSFGSGLDRYDLSQGNKEKPLEGNASLTGAEGSFEASSNGSPGSNEGGNVADGGVSAMLRSIWEKGTEMSPSVE